jgi:hypothetical protein
MTTTERQEAQALSTRAAIIESQLQAARSAHNVDHQRRLEDEHRRIWERYPDLPPISGPGEG